MGNVTFEVTTFIAIFAFWGAIAYMMGKISTIKKSIEFNERTANNLPEPKAFSSS